MTSLTEELTQLKALLDAGAITQEEFDAKKAEMLERDTAALTRSLAQAANDEAAATSEKSKIAAGILAIFLGALGGHKFYLGYTKEGVIMLLVSLLTLGIGASVIGVIALVEGIIYLTKSDADFYTTYVVGHKGWF